jgi:diacylglycerol kinase family enzyme
VIANGSSFGGGHRVFEASPFDGRLNVVAVRPRPLYQLFVLWLRAWLRRSTPRHEAIVLRRGTTCEIDCQRRRATADGDPVGMVPGRFSVVPGALRVMVPEASADTGIIGRRQ